MNVTSLRVLDVCNGFGSRDVGRGVIIVCRSSIRKDQVRSSFLKRGVFSDYSRGEVPKALLLHVCVYDRYLQSAGELLLIVAARGFIVGKATLVEVCPNHQSWPVDLNTCFTTCPYNVT